MNEKHHFLYFISTSILLSVVTISAFMLTDATRDQHSRRPINTRASETSTLTNKPQTLVTNIQKQLTLSSHATQLSSPVYTVDGNEATSWDSGLPATHEMPQWVEINLSESTLTTTKKISALSLYSNQGYPEHAIHKIYAGNAHETLRLVQILDQIVKPHEILTVTFEPPLENTTYFRILTEQSSFPVSWKEIKIYQPTIH